MRPYDDALSALRFTEEEQTMLIKRLTQAVHAAEKPARRRHPRRVLCIALAATCALTITAAAASSLAPILQGYFQYSTPDARETLSQSVLPLDLVQSHDGYTIRLRECIGDEARLYIAGALTLPDDPAEGRTPALLGGALTSDDAAFQAEIAPGAAVCAIGGHEISYAWNNYDRATRTVPFTLIFNTYWSVQGARATLTFDGICEQYATGEQVSVCAQPFVFSDLSLDYQTPVITLQPNVQTRLPYDTTGSEASLTALTVTPLSVVAHFTSDRDGSDYPRGDTPTAIVFYDKNGAPLLTGDAGRSTDVFGESSVLTERQSFRQLLDLSQVSYIEVNGLRLDLPPA